MLAERHAKLEFVTTIVTTGAEREATKSPATAKRAQG
jgi:hypothetical protein